MVSSRQRSYPIRAGEGVTLSQRWKQSFFERRKSMVKATYRWIALMMAAALFAGVGSAQGEEKSAEISMKQEKATPKSGQVMVLSLQESILLGLKNNLDIAIEGFNPKIRATDVTAAKAVFDPDVFAEVGFGSTQTPNRNQLADVRTSENDDFDWSFDLPTGGSYELRFDNNRNFNNAGFFVPKDNQGNPIGVDLRTAYSSDLSLTVIQPLLKNFGVDINRTQIKIAENDREISLDRFRETIMDVVTQRRPQSRAAVTPPGPGVGRVEPGPGPGRGGGSGGGHPGRDRYRGERSAGHRGREAGTGCGGSSEGGPEYSEAGGVGRGCPSGGPGPFFPNHPGPSRRGGRRPPHAAGV
jgi:hypothetical protein